MLSRFYDSSRIPTVESQMASDQTEHQDSEAQRRTIELSLKRTAPPAEVPGYEIEEFLGSGAYGEVWVGIDRNTRRRVAIKFFTRGSSVDFSLLSREVEKLVYLSADRYVVQLLDVGWEADPPYYVMDYIQNGSLEEEIARHGRFSQEHATEMFKEIATGLMHLHGKGILHCDLKPGNVLLDQDHKPRLADFGQSRLSHEQSPALGTLFFMAPEQADLNAIPDARWDVFALGALFYCMLTGLPPYRSDSIIEEMESVTEMSERLERYRRAICSAEKPSAHRQLASLDRQLADIIDRCIDVRPAKRFDSVQSVMLALRNREETRAKAPVMILGLVGPLVLLFVMMVFGFGAYQRAVTQGDRSLTRKAMESNGWAAQFAARSAAEQIDDYFSAVIRIAQDPQLQIDLKRVLEDEACASLLAELDDPHDNGNQSLESQRERFRQLEIRQPLQEKMNELINRSDLPHAASWFVSDTRGTQLASAFDIPSVKPTIGKNYSYRTYFQGGQSDRSSIQPDGTTRYDVAKLGTPRKHIETPHLSAIFASTATNTWKVAFSAPIMIDEKFVGIVAATVEMGNFIDFEHRDVQFAMMVDGREGENRGVILEHPLFAEIRESNETLPKRFNDYRVDLNSINESEKRFRDPLGFDELGAGYSQEWIAAKRPVLSRHRITQGAGPTPTSDTGLVVIALEDAEAVVAPAHRLGGQLFNLGIWALAIVTIVALIMWYMVIRTVRETRDRVGRSFSKTSEVTSIHSEETLPASPG